MELLFCGEALFLAEVSFREEVAFCEESAFCEEAAFLEFPAFEDDAPLLALPALREEEVLPEEVSSLGAISKTLMG